ncbi:hypothetical protein MP638_000769 [Amoeboaphelidium occidentale]|nr:hypothetical protein MP638_000769 [Amoeboaphelidium occidentale]
MDLDNAKFLVRPPSCCCAVSYVIDYPSRVPSQLVNSLSQEAYSCRMDGIRRNLRKLHFYLLTIIYPLLMASLLITAIALIYTMPLSCPNTTSDPFYEFYSPETVGNMCNSEIKRQQITWTIVCSVVVIVIAPIAMVILYNLMYRQLMLNIHNLLQQFNHSDESLFWFIDDQSSSGCNWKGFCGKTFEISVTCKMFETKPNISRISNDISYASYYAPSVRNSALDRLSQVLPEVSYGSIPPQGYAPNESCDNFNYVSQAGAMSDLGSNDKI